MNVKFRFNSLVPTRSFSDSGPSSPTMTSNTDSPSHSSNSSNSSKKQYHSKASRRKLKDKESFYSSLSDLTKIDNIEKSSASLKLGSSSSYESEKGKSSVFFPQIKRSDKGIMRTRSKSFEQRRSFSDSGLNVDPGFKAEERQFSGGESKSLNLSHVIPHRFHSFTFTSLKSPTCNFCGTQFKKLMCKAYKCNECQYLCHPRCLPSIPPDCGKLKLDSLPVRTMSSPPSMNAPKKVFGVELSEQAKLDSNNIPLIVVSCINAVEKRGLHIEGIYRVPGSNIQTQKLRSSFSSGIPNLDDPDWLDIAIVTTVIKQYLRELPTPVICTSIYDKLLKITQSDETKVEKIEKTINELPLCHKETLGFVIRHLDKVDKHHPQNKMTSYNLSLLFGPTLMRAPTATRDLEEMHEQAKVIEHMILHCDKIFK